MFILPIQPGQFLVYTGKISEICLVGLIDWRLKNTDFSQKMKTPDRCINVKFHFVFYFGVTVSEDGNLASPTFPTHRRTPSGNVPKRPAPPPPKPRTSTSSAPQQPPTPTASLYPSLPKQPDHQPPPPPKPKLAALAKASVDAPDQWVLCFVYCSSFIVFYALKSCWPHSY